MSRIACLYAPALPLQAALRAEPDLAGAPLAVTDGPGPRARILAASPEAEAGGVRPGMTASQATGVLSALAVRARSPAAVRSASDALGDAARAFAAKVERAAEDLVYLEVGDLGRLFPREAALAAALEAAVGKVGLAARAGVAGSKAAARLAALSEVTVVPPGEERRFLATVPVEWANPEPELAASLSRLGLRTLGDVAALPGASLGRRLGREGAALWRLSRGEDAEPLCPEPELEVFAEGVDLDWALDSLEPLSFLLSGALSRLCARLAARGLACAGLSLRLSLAPRGSDARDVAVAAPTVESPVLLSLVRLSLEARPPPGPVRGLWASARAAPMRPAQLALFGPRQPAPDRLAATVAKLAALCGAERVGAPAVVDGHRPEAEAMAPLELPPPPHIPPAPLSHTGLALRRLGPRPARVLLAGLTPVALDGSRLRAAAGPWRVEGEWWSGAPFARDYYDLETETGVLYRVYREQEGGWFVDGVYD